MVSRVESGQKTLRFDGVVKAATELQVSIDYLAGLTDDPEPAARLAGQLARERARGSELEDSGALALNPSGGNPRLHLFARPGINPVPPPTERRHSRRGREETPTTSTCSAMSRSATTGSKTTI